MVKDTLLGIAATAAGTTIATVVVDIDLVGDS